MSAFVYDAARLHGSLLRQITVVEPSWRSATRGLDRGRVHDVKYPNILEAFVSYPAAMPPARLSVYGAFAPGVIDSSAPIAHWLDIAGGRAADFDADGVQDVTGLVRQAGASSEDPGFGVAFGARAGTIDFAATVDWRMSEGASGHVVSLDLDDDGDDDIVFQSEADGLTYLFEGGPDRAAE